MNRCSGSRSMNGFLSSAEPVRVPCQWRRRHLGRFQMQFDAYGWRLDRDRVKR